MFKIKVNQQIPLTNPLYWFIPVCVCGGAPERGCLQLKCAKWNNKSISTVFCVLVECAIVWVLQKIDFWSSWLWTHWCSGTFTLLFSTAIVITPKRSVSLLYQTLNLTFMTIWFYPYPPFNLPPITFCLPSFISSPLPFSLSSLASDLLVWRRSHAASLGMTRALCLLPRREGREHEMGGRERAGEKEGGWMRGREIWRAETP